jgi:histidyl-tRNA synthetase
MSDRSRSFRAPPGTYDLMPPESWRWQTVMRLAMDTFARAGYEPVETPMFEHTEVFERGVGMTSEVVRKQMYTFPDLGGRSLTLRPEGTAPVVRAVLEHKIARGALSGSSPLKLAYAAPMFRQERPQKGRYRQFFQAGIEAIGSDNPVVDAEVIEVGVRFLRAAGVEPRVMLNSIGHADDSCRKGYLKLLAEYLSDNEARLAEEDRERAKSNALRTFDSKNPVTQAVMKDAPPISQHLCDDCREHFDTVTSILDEIGVAFELDTSLVRGLDYYTRTAFEYLSEGLGAQNAVGGGGRYDGLAEALGGPPLPGVGFALGIDRILLAQVGESPTPHPDAYVVGNAPATLRIATRLREAGITSELDLADRSTTGQLKQAERLGARWVVFVADDDDEVTLKDLASGHEVRVPVSELSEAVRR